ncbi:MAG: zf-HC2 domain-containing protein [Pyrinomonadaceae bacterium]
MLKRLRRTLAEINQARAPMNCARVGKLIPLHVAGDLPAQRARAVAQHLDACAQCRTTADDYAASRAWLQTGAQPVFADAFYDDIRTAVLRQIKQAQRPAPFFASFSTRRLAYVAAAVALVCVVCALAWHAQFRHEPGTGVASNNRNEAAAPTPTPISMPSSTERANEEQPHQKIIKQGGPRRSPNTGPPARLLHTTHEETASRPQLKRAPVLLPTNPDEPGTAAAATEVARIEIQTADPNIRIIWLAPSTADALPKKEEK